MRHQLFRDDFDGLWRILKVKMGPELLPEFSLRNDDRTNGHRLILLKLNSGGLTLMYHLSRKAISLWNSFPAFVVEEDSKGGFKRRLEEHFTCPFQTQSRAHLDM